ncbi:MAG: hypothetical protein B7C24_11815 [Bacteroidetes bacterium 4572_77]|nr:MAG: hypothetical protein B7C24_11815 [Bacteroidetes bacterium 4572_77]
MSQFYNLKEKSIFNLKESLREKSAPSDMVLQNIRNFSAAYQAIEGKQSEKHKMKTFHLILN